MAIVCLLLLAVAPLLAATTPARVVHFGGNTAIIETKDRVEHIVIRDRSGALTTETYCDWQSGTYDQIVALRNALKAAAARKDRTSLIALMEFPLRVNTAPNRGFSIPSSRALLARYATVFTPGVIAALRNDDPHDVFCRNGMSFVSGGLMWSTADRHGRLRVAVINL
jgi:hypothetical protein